MRVARDGSIRQDGSLIHAHLPSPPLLSGAEINKIKRNYQESQSRRNHQLKGLGDELQGVQKIMYENIDAVLQRGELISGKEGSRDPLYSEPTTRACF